MTEKLELMVAVRPTFHEPAIFAKQAANIDHISDGRLSLNVVSSWWKDEARRYGIHFEEHDDRYARTDEWLRIVDGTWSEARFSHAGNALPGGGDDPRAQADAESSRPRSTPVVKARAAKDAHLARVRCVRDAW